MIGVASHSCFFIMKNNPLFHQTKNQMESFGYRVVQFDFQRPWGGFLVIDETQAPKFADQFFDGLDTNTLKIGGKLSPKILMVLPNSRLSWQYHHRRAEIWRVYRGKVGIVRSPDDHQNPIEHLHQGDLVTLKQGERHRLIGLDQNAIIAEIWQHTDPNHPSDEEDIVRVQDDFGR
jgi:mannose-6-phosphate isomerase